MSLHARPAFRVWGHGRGRLIRAMYRDGFNFTEIAVTVGMKRASVRRTIRFKAA